MERRSSVGSSWADQWDHSDANTAAAVPAKKSSKTKDGLERAKGLASTGFEKTKAMASTGFKKAKEGTAVGFHWIKDKYQKRTNHKH